MTAKNFLLFSDFDQTLVRQGGELAYLLLHDPDFRRVRRDQLIEVGKRIRLKANIPRLIERSKGLSPRAIFTVRASATMRTQGRFSRLCSCPRATARTL
jgi:hypothetical protein